MLKHWRALPRSLYKKALVGAEKVIKDTLSSQYLNPEKGTRTERSFISHSKFPTRKIVFIQKRVSAGNG